jgi:hypothetical protein
LHTSSAAERAVARVKTDQFLTVEGIIDINFAQQVPATSGVTSSLEGERSCCAHRSPIMAATEFSARRPEKSLRGSLLYRHSGSVIQALFLEIVYRRDCFAGSAASVNAM